MSLGLILSVLLMYKTSSKITASTAEFYKSLSKTLTTKFSSEVAGSSVCTDNLTCKFYKNLVYFSLKGEFSYPT